MPVKKKKLITKKNKTTHRKQENGLSWYLREREEFYTKHPYARLLIGMLIVSFAISLGALYYNKNIVYIGLYLDHDYSIRYPYIP